jgi:hypothetical protein
MSIKSDALLHFRFSIAIENALSEAVTELALTVPTTLGPSAYFYIIAQCTTTWPLFYFLQVANIATGLLRLNWINRILKGGYVALNFKATAVVAAAASLKSFLMVSVLISKLFFCSHSYSIPFADLAALEARFHIAFMSTVDMFLLA